MGGDEASPEEAAAHMGRSRAWTLEFEFQVLPRALARASPRPPGSAEWPWGFDPRTEGFVNHISPPSAAEMEQQMACGIIEGHGRCLGVLFGFPYHTIAHNFRKKNLTCMEY